MLQPLLETGDLSQDKEMQDVQALPNHGHHGEDIEAGRNHPSNLPPEVTQKSSIYIIDLDCFVEAD